MLAKQIVASIKICGIIILKINIMKYNININQKKAVEWGLTSSEAIVFSWVYELASWADKMEYKGKTYYYGSKNKACEELPIITDKRDTMYRIFKSLQGKGLIELITLDKSDYLSLTKKGKEWYNNKCSEKNPSFGNNSKETESGPTDNNTREEKDNIKEDTNVSKKDCNCANDVSEQVEELYAMYPTKCPKRNISLGKSFKCKDKLRKLIKQYGYEMLKFTISKECEEKYGKSYMLNFSTFLNNLPDYGYVKSESNESSDVTDNKSNYININGVTYK